MKNKFNIGDKVRLKAEQESIFGLTPTIVKGTEFTVKYIQKNKIDGETVSYSYSDWDKKNKNSETIIPEFRVIPEKELELVKRNEEKIVIYIDKEDQNKIVALDTATKRTGEAHRNPNDEWDFYKGAELAFKRLKEPEKKYWNGKVICTRNGGNNFFTKGKVYSILDGQFISDSGNKYIIGCDRRSLIKTIEDLSDKDKIPSYCEFIEYKGEVIPKWASLRI